MNLIKHNYKLLKECEHAMLDGEVFWFAGDKIYYAEATKRFCVNEDTHLLNMWVKNWEDWKIEKPHKWEGDLKDGSILCYVSDTLEDLENNAKLSKIKYYLPNNRCPYLSIKSVRWVFAKPVPHDDPAIYRGGKNE